MATSGHWRPLKLSYNGPPKLLVKLALDGTGYTVSVTDLANIWIESLSNAQIIADAESQNCGINPGDDSGQLQILLNKIHDVLGSEPGTAVSIGLRSPDDLTLMLKAPLPSPLPCFEWIMTLSKATSADLASEVLSPVLCLAFQQQHQLEHLLVQLRDKDHAMSRLLDKMEATNTDLGSVFPGVSAGRHSQRSLKRNQVARHVRGLAPFQQGSEKQHTGGVPSVDDLYGVLQSINDDKMKGLLRPPSDTWWYDLSNQQKDAEIGTNIATGESEDETDDDLDFQTQTIPEHLQRQQPANISSPVRPSRLNRIRASTDDTSTDEDRVASSPPPIPPDILRSETEGPAPDSPSKRPDTQSRRLGSLGGRSSSQAPLPQSPLKLSTTYLDSRAQLRDSQTPPPALPPQSQPTPSKIRRLGGIGRGSSQMQPSMNRWSSQALPILQEELDRSTPGLRNTDETAQRPAAESRQTRAMKRKASEEREPSPRETSVERADRKRRELKDNLNEKPKATTKKKRRF